MQRATDMARIGVVTDWLVEFGGAENVTYAIAEVTGTSEIWTMTDSRPVACAPRSRLVWPWLSPLTGSRPVVAAAATMAWRHGAFHASDFDMVVSSHHLQAHTAATLDVPHYSYVHTPARYAWYPEVDGRAGGLLGAALARRIRSNDIAASKRVRSYAANSATTAQRIRECWDRDAVVIHPPVDVEFFAATKQDFLNSPEPYLLAAGRWVPYKRFDRCIAIAEACDLPLVIAGQGPDEGRLRALAANLRVPVTFVVAPTREQLRHLYRDALVLLSPAHEDFGIVPVEAMATGTPVVGPAIGGLRETVTDGISGVLLESDDLHAWTIAVHRASSFVPTSVAEIARRFDPHAFQAGIASWLNQN